MNIDSKDAEMVGPLNLKPHYQELCKAALANEFDGIEKLLSDFWGKVTASQRDKLKDADAVDAMFRSDMSFYEALIHRLLPDVFAEVPPPQTKQVRSFAKMIDQWVIAAVDGFPEAFVDAKQRAATQFGQRLRRYTGLNHLVQAAKSVLTNPAHVSQMQEDYLKVDVSAAQEQMIAICGDDGCPIETVAKHEATFRRLQQATNTTLEAWASWLQDVVEQGMGPYTSDEQYATAGADLLLRWSFISSLIIRDLTLRSAASFGPFHLMRLLCDEYVYYLVEAAQRTRGPRPFTMENVPDLILKTEDAAGDAADTLAGGASSVGDGAWCTGTVHGVWCPCLACLLSGRAESYTVCARFVCFFLFWLAPCACPWVAQTSDVSMRVWMCLVRESSLQDPSVNLTMMSSTTPSGSKLK
eukprot:m.97564 g.97564  ORF g.97564 m.97564 type:complete len:412 (+) comp10220_c0_seq4:376-1611(+)